MHGETTWWVVVVTTEVLRYGPEARGIAHPSLPIHLFRQIELELTDLAVVQGADLVRRRGIVGRRVKSGSHLKSISRAKSLPLQLSD